MGQISESQARNTVLIVNMLMGPIEYLQITAPEKDTRIRKRHQSEISELMTLGFDYLSSEGQRFPLTRMLRVFPALVALDAWTQRTPIWITGGAILFGYPILVYRPKPTYVELDALHAKFVTAFEDGVVLVSGNYDDPLPDRPGVLRQFQVGTLVETWGSHQGRVRALESVGKKVDPSCDYQAYHQASAQDRAAW